MAGKKKSGQPDPAEDLGQPAWAKGLRLTEFQIRFVEEYLIRPNAAAAAREAGYSENSAKQIGQQTLHKPNVQKALAAARKERTRRARKKADDIIRELERLAFADMRALGEWDAEGRWTPYPSDELDDDAAVTLSKIDCKRELRSGGEDGDTEVIHTKVHLWDKVKALDLLADIHGLSKDKRDRIQLERERLELEKAKQAVGEGAEDGVIVLPELDAPQELPPLEIEEDAP